MDTCGIRTPLSQCKCDVLAITLHGPYTITVSSIKLPTVTFALTHGQSCTYLFVPSHNNGMTVNALFHPANPLYCYCVRQAGLEPARDCSHYPLKVACIPISPLSHIYCCAGRIRTSDFQVMSLTSYLCSTAQADRVGFEPTTNGLRTVMEYRPPYYFQTVAFGFLVPNH